MQRTFMVIHLGFFRPHTRHKAGAYPTIAPPSIVPMHLFVFEQIRTCASLEAWEVLFLNLFVTVHLYCTITFQSIAHMNFADGLIPDKNEEPASNRPSKSHRK